MSRPWMPLYCADYIGHTTHLSAAESGAYLHLIMHYWVHGALPTQDGPLSRIAKMTPKEWSASRATLAEFFKDGWKHDRIDRELADAEAAYLRRSKAGKTGGLAKANGRQKSSNAKSELGALHKQSLSQLDISSEEEDIEKTQDKNLVEEFDRWMSAYPRKTSQDAARRLYEEIVSTGKATTDELLAGARRYILETAGTDPKWLKAPGTWLTGGCWKDGISPNAAPRQADGIIVDEASEDGRAWSDHQIATTGKPPKWVYGKKIFPSARPPAQDSGSAPP